LLFKIQLNTAALTGLAGCRSEATGKGEW